MKPISWVGLLLVVAGVVVLALRGFSYTTQETVLEVGPIKATAEKQHDVYFYPAAGIAAIVIGGVLVVVGRRSA